MKREGRQHGTVRTCCIYPSPLSPPPDAHIINRIHSPATAGIFTKVDRRPTNHSKFTGKCTKSQCDGCHFNPSCKSKHKTKGTHKVKSFDVVSNFRLSFSGFSASGMLDHLDNQFVDDDDDDREIEIDYDRWEPEIREIEDDNVDCEVEDELGFCDLGLVLDKVEEDGDWCLVAQM